MRNIWIEYDGGKINIGLDSKLEELLAPEGFIRTGSGLHFEEQKRDLHFVREAEDKK